VRFQFCIATRLRTDVFWVAALSRRASDCRRLEQSCCFHFRGLGSPRRRDSSCRSAQHLKMKAKRCFGTWRVTDCATERNNTAADLNLRWLIPGVHEVGQWMCRKSFLWFHLSSHTVFDCRLLCQKRPSVQCSKLTLNCKELPPWCRFRPVELTASQRVRKFSTYYWI